jgi:hypothetical protein
MNIDHIRKSGKWRPKTTHRLAQCNKSNHILRRYYGGKRMLPVLGAIEIPEMEIIKPISSKRNFNRK